MDVGGGKGVEGGMSVKEDEGFLECDIKGVGDWGVKGGGVRE